MQTEAGYYTAHALMGVEVTNMARRKAGLSRNLNFLPNVYPSDRGPSASYNPS